MHRLTVFLPALFLLVSCDEAVELDAAQAREAMYKERSQFVWSSVCSAALFNESKQAACEQEKQARKAAFRFELLECEPGSPDDVKALIGPVKEPATCTVRWANDIEQTRPLKSSVVLFHVIDGKLQAAMIATAK